VRLSKSIRTSREFGSADLWIAWQANSFPPTFSEKPLEFVLSSTFGRANPILRTVSNVICLGMPVSARSNNSPELKREAKGSLKRS
jgi:hypothetical protein